MSLLPEIIKRSLLAEYLDTTPAGTSPTWSRIGFGVEGKNTDYAPEVDERQFIDEDSPNASIKNYKQTSEFDIIAAKNSAVFAYLDVLRISRATYADAETDYLEVRLYDPVDADLQPNVFNATRTRMAVSVTGIGDAAEDPLTLSAALNGKGDPVQGVFDFSTLTFTATGTALETAATPVADPVAGAVASGSTVALTTATVGATIHYTIDGSTPTVGSMVYSAPLAIYAPTTIKAIAVMAGMNNSAILTAAYTVT